MPEPATHRSLRFVQAAKSERRRLTQKRSKLAKRREDMQAKLDALDAELEAVDQEIIVIDELTNSNGSSPAIPLGLAAGNHDAPNQLRGGRIRDVAIPLLMRERGSAPIHYREWLSLLESAGYEVAGKRPDAVFLNQVVRSPLVRATTQAGYYQLELEAHQQLRERLQSQQAELAELLQEAPEDPAAFERHREKQRELKSSIAKTERELDEASNVLDEQAEEPEPPALEPPRIRRVA
jgi:predicted nuclease with TOPRIM domain